MTRRLTVGQRAERELFQSDQTLRLSPAARYYPVYQPPRLEGKRCSKCGETKPLDAFGHSSRNGTQHWCRDCNAAYMARRHEAFRVLRERHVVEWERLLIFARHSPATRGLGSQKRQYLARRELVKRHQAEFDQLLAEVEAVR